MTEATIDLGFVLLSAKALPDEKTLIRSAAAMGAGTLVPEGGDPSAKDVRVYRIGGKVTLMVALMPVPHPDISAMPMGWASPDLDPGGAPAHLIVSGLGLAGDVRERDGTMARLVAAVLESSPAIAGMLGHGVTFIEKETFLQAVRDAETLPIEACVDLTVAGEGPRRASLLTHGMQRYGREEIYVTAARDQASEALNFIWGIADWLLSSDEKLPTGDTVGRTAEEKVKVQRVPNPTGEGPQVIRLDL